MNNDWERILQDIHLALIVFVSLGMSALVVTRHLESLALAGIVIGMQCYGYVLQEENRERILLLVLRLVILTLFIWDTGYWEGCVLHYLVLNPQNPQQRKRSCALPLVGMMFLWITRRPESILLFILFMMVMAGITALLYCMDELLAQMQQKEEQLELQLQSTATNELKVKNLNRELAIKYQLTDRNARLEERENIARNIHNVVGHTITASIVSLQAYSALKGVDPEQAEGKLNASMERMRNALEEIRRAVRVLDQGTEIVSCSDFCKILKTELERFALDTEIKISHNLDEIRIDQEISKRYCEFLHSVVTECLNNGIRHGHATAFLVRLQCSPKDIQISVADNGMGFQNMSKEEQQSRLSKGYGLRKIQKYVLEHGGKVTLETENGFHIMVNLPVF